MYSEKLELPLQTKFVSNFFMHILMAIFYLLFILYSRWEPAQHFECPKDDFPYFFTNKNSQEYFRMKQNDA